MVDSYMHANNQQETYIIINLFNIFIIIIIIIINGKRAFPRQ